jgi:hypothetical protein
VGTSRRGALAGGLVTAAAAAGVLLGATRGGAPREADVRALGYVASQIGVPSVPPPGASPRRIN